MAFIRRNSNLLFVIVLPVYLYIVQTSIQNKHTHVYANGIVITHSHPFNHKGDTPINHHHSKREICLYSTLHFDYYQNPEEQGLIVNLNESHKNYYIHEESVVYTPDFLKIIPRGPPA